jgi:ribosomal protein L12E/L44/L45/RPP1/RPP2
MSYAVARALLIRAGRTVDAESYLHAANQPGGVRLEHRRVQVVERSPMNELP